MNATPSDRLVIPESLSAHDRFLVEKTQEALADGLELERWSRDPNRVVNEFPVDLKKPYTLPYKAYAYFSDVRIGDRTLPAVGIRQEVEFGKAPGPNPAEQLKRYVLSAFLPTSQWTYPNGWPGGFTFEQMLYCTADGRVGRYPEDQRASPLDWTLIGTKYRWSLVTIFLHDFVVKMGPLVHKFPEAVAVVQHPDFLHVVERPAGGYKLEAAFGYPFIDFAPIPNHFGFGPGKFDWAVKTFSFKLRDDNTVRCDMDFVAGARPKKVFDFGKHVPCPLYGGATALQAVTLGLWKGRKFHDWMDAAMMRQHGRVHQSLMEGAAKVFAEWVRSADKPTL